MIKEARELFAGPGEMRARCRELDWAETPLGPVERWPQSLCTAAAIVLGSGFPTILVWGPDRVQLYNDAYAQLIGVRHPGALGRATHEVWPEIRDKQERIFCRVFAGETVQLIDEPYRLRRGIDTEDAYFTASFIPVPDDSGVVGGSLSTLIETTQQVLTREYEFERARLERAMRESDARLSGIIGSAMDAIITVDEEQRVVLFNAAAERLFGVSAGHAIGSVLDRFIPERFRGRHRDDVEAFGKTGVTTRSMGHPGSVIALRADGSEFPIEASISQAVTETGRFYTVILRDISARRQAEEERDRLLEAERAARSQVEQLNTELHRAVTDLQAVLDVVPIGIGIAQDPECSDIRVNPAFAQQLGIDPTINASKSGPTGSALPFRVFKDGREVAADELPMQRAVRERRALSHVELDVVHADGRMVRLLEYSAPLFNDEGEVRGAVGAFVDITEHARLVAAERAARAEAERANRAKAEFLAVMSHELRTPLNAIGGYAELLAMGVRGPVTETQLEDLERIQRSQRHLLGLINEVLNYAKIETGGVRFHIEDVGLAGAVGEVESLILPQVREKALIFDTDGCDPHLMARADPEKLRQILVNLLSNAVKFTGRGGRISVAITEVDRALRGPMAELAVTDTGVGIAADKLDVIFEPFVQVGRAHNNPGEGVGLGLAISRDLARGMGGDLTAESHPGVGSTFRLTLRRA